MSQDLIFFFGCWDMAGHTLRHSDGRAVKNARSLGIPDEYMLDGGVLFLPFPEKVGTGALTFLPSPNVTILAWWGNPWDKRGAVNNAIISKNQFCADEIWDEFVRVFPARLTSQLLKPEIIKTS